MIARIVCRCPFANAVSYFHCKKFNFFSLFFSSPGTVHKIRSKSVKGFADSRLFFSLFLLLSLVSEQISTCCTWFYFWWILAPVSRVCRSWRPSVKKIKKKRKTIFKMISIPFYSSSTQGCKKKTPVVFYLQKQHKIIGIQSSEQVFDCSQFHSNKQK